MADKKGRFELNIFFIIESGNAEVIKKATPVIKEWLKFPMLTRLLISVRIFGFLILVISGLSRFVLCIFRA